MEINFELNGCRIEYLSRTRLENVITKAANDGHTKINILLSTQGGEIYQALEFYRFIKAHNYPITMTNIGEVNSCGIIMFLAAEERYFAPDARFLFNGVRTKNEPDEDKKKKMAEFNKEMLDVIKATVYLPDECIWLLENTLFDVVIRTGDEIEKHRIAVPARPANGNIRTIPIPCL